MFFNLKLLLSAAVLSLTIFSMANANEPEAHGEKPKAAANSAPGGEKAWVNIQNQVLVLKTRRMQLMQNMQALKDQTKKHTGKGKDDPRQIKDEVDNLVKFYKEYKEVTEEYNKLLVVLKYRFPERLAKEEEREYKAVEVESLEELEQKLDIDGRLTKVYKKAQSQYRPQSEKREPAAEKPNLPPAKDSSGPRGNTIREQDPILMSQ